MTTHESDIDTYNNLLPTINRFLDLRTNHKIMCTDGSHIRFYRRYGSEPLVVHQTVANEGVSPLAISIDGGRALTLRDDGALFINKQRLARVMDFIYRNVLLDVLASSTQDE